MTQPLTIEFFNDAWKKQRGYVEANAKYAKRGCIPGDLRGQTVLVCGAGPSLASDFDAAYQLYQPTQVWGCNSALTYLHRLGKPVTHGVAVAGEDGLLDDWKPFPPVRYYVASGVSPLVIRLLAKKNRPMAFFHNLLGLCEKATDEVNLYSRLYPPSIVIQRGGLNVTNRAVVLALEMGADHVAVTGADCCFKITDDPMPHPDPTVSDEECNRLHWDWAKRQTMYADGRDPVQAMGQSPILEGVLAGRRVVSRPDMLISAQDLVGLQRQYGSRLSLLGDTLPNHMLTMDEEEWRAFMPQMNGNAGVVNIGRQPVGIAKHHEGLAKSNEGR
jgi:hypothetical protein